MRIHEIKVPAGAKHRRKRVGRGDSSGHGKTSGRGTKGQKSRSGGGVRPGFEGGQLPLFKRLPRLRGFTNIFRVEYEIVNLQALNQFAADSEVTPETLQAHRLVSRPERPVKILGNGELRHALRIKAHKFSASAREKIEAAGGSVEVISK